MTTGYFGIPGNKDRHDNHHVHVVDNGRPVCGTRVHPGSQYQWCAHGIQQDYVDCQRCKQWLMRSRS